MLRPINCQGLIDLAVNIFVVSAHRRLLLLGVAVSKATCHNRNKDQHAQGDPQPGQVGAARGGRHSGPRISTLLQLLTTDIAGENAVFRLPQVKGLVHS